MSRKDAIDPPYLWHEVVEPASLQPQFGVGVQSAVRVEAGDRRRHPSSRARPVQAEWTYAVDVDACNAQSFSYFLCETKVMVFMSSGKYNDTINDTTCINNSTVKLSLFRKLPGNCLLIRRLYKT